MATAGATRSTITLKGSTDIVTEFFDPNKEPPISILYQRGIYPPESFTQVKKYGLTMLVTTDDGVKQYLREVLLQLREWLMQAVVQKVVIVISSSESGEVLERWVFNIECDKTVLNGDMREKPEKEITHEIQAIVRQITASVTFLPLLDEPCTFDMLMYTDADVDIPGQWEESEPKHVKQSQEVKLRSFTTKIHSVDGMISYRMDPNDM